MTFLKRQKCGDARAFLVAQMVKNLPAMQETQVQSLGGDDPLEKAMAKMKTMMVINVY